jgi:hypothetical protein
MANQQKKLMLSGESYKISFERSRDGSGADGPDREESR